MINIPNTIDLVRKTNFNVKITEIDIKYLITKVAWLPKLVSTTKFAEIRIKMSGAVDFLKLILTQN